MYMRRALLFTGLCLLVFLINHSYSYATSGACSWHGGVNCSAGSDSDSSVICNDGWRDSTVPYSFTAECSTTPKLGCTTQEWRSLTQKYEVLEMFAENDLKFKEISDLDEQKKAIDQKLKTFPSYNDFLINPTQEERQLNIQSTYLSNQQMALLSTIRMNQGLISQIISQIDSECKDLGADRYRENQLEILKYKTQSNTPSQQIPTPTPTADPIDLCFQKLGLNAKVMGQACICVNGFMLNTENNYCIPITKTSVAPIPEIIKPVKKVESVKLPRSRTAEPIDNKIIKPISIQPTTTQLTATATSLSVQPKPTPTKPVPWFKKIQLFGFKLFK